MDIFKIRLISAHRGASLAEWALLASLTASAGIGSAFAFGEKVERVFLGANAVLRGEQAYVLEAGAPAPAENCYPGTLLDDQVSYVEGTDCYRLGRGDDIFDGRLSDVDLRVFAGQGRLGTGEILSGEGSDLLETRQGGRVEAGGGDDEILISLRGGSGGSRFHVDPGPGNDRLDISATRKPVGAPENSISTGTGSLKATVDCDGDIVGLRLQGGSSTMLSGNCGFDLQEVRDASPGMTVLKAASVPYVSGRLDKISRVQFDISVLSESDGNPAQGLYFPSLEYGDILYRAHALTPVDFQLAGNNLLPASRVHVDIAASEGTVTFEAAGQENWTASVDYGGQGQIQLRFPLENGMASMRAPRLSGHVGVLDVSGCFDEIEIDGAVSGRPDPCRAAGDTRIEIPDPGSVVTVILRRGGEDTTIRLGEGYLRARVLLFSK